MTSVEFHFNAPDKVAYACRLLRKALAQGAQAVVTADAEQLARLDVQLWTFGALEFLPHCRAGDDAAVLARSPIVLSTSAAEAPVRPVLLNLGDAVPQGFERFERLIEVVAQDEGDRLQARQRWKHYADRGYAIERRDLALKEAA